MVWSLFTRRVERSEKWRSSSAAGGVGAHTAFAGEGLGLPDLGGDRAEGSVDGAVLAGDFHLEDLPGVLPGGDPGVGEEGEETFLEGAKAALDFAPFDFAQGMLWPGESE